MSSELAAERSQSDASELQWHLFAAELRCCRSEFHCEGAHCVHFGPAKHSGKWPKWQLKLAAQFTHTHNSPFSIRRPIVDQFSQWQSFPIFNLSSSNLKQNWRPSPTSTASFSPTNCGPLAPAAKEQHRLGRVLPFWSPFFSKYYQKKKKKRNTRALHCACLNNIIWPPFCALNTHREQRRGHTSRPVGSRQSWANIAQEFLLFARELKKWRTGQVREWTKRRWLRVHVCLGPVCATQLSV